MDIKMKKKINKYVLYDYLFKISFIYIFFFNSKLLLYICLFIYLNDIVLLYLDAIIIINYKKNVK